MSALRRRDLLARSGAVAAWRGSAAGVFGSCARVFGQWSPVVSVGASGKTWVVKAGTVSGAVVGSTGAGAGAAGAVYRAALSEQPRVGAVVTAGILTPRRKVRARLAHEGVVVPPIREVIARRRAR